MSKYLRNKAPVILFAVIITIAACLRLYRLDSIPPGVNRDEASIGYTAYSILKTGKDEYGRSFPLSFESFGDWKLPLYIYLTVPMVKFFGLTEVAVRLTSALAGTAIVGLTFLLVKLLFKNTQLALLTMAVAAIAPWAIHLSRVESESNLAVFLTTLGALLFFKANKQRSWLYAVSFILWAITYATYAGNHVFTTLLVLGILILFRKIIFAHKFGIIGFIIFLCLASFIFSQTLLGADKTKISGISIFSNPYVVYQQIELPRLIHDNPNGIATRLFHNRISYALETVLQNYMKSFSPEFLAISGGSNHAHNIANFGNIYLIEFPFLILGFAYLLTMLKDPKMKFILFWFLISPIAASITKDAPHTNRMFAIFPILPLIISLGIYWLAFKVKENKIMLMTVACIIMLAYSVNVGIYFDRYYVHFPKNETHYWSIDYKNVTKILTSTVNNKKHIIIANPEQSPYIFLLFYLGYDPATYRKFAIRYASTTDGFGHVRSFDRFEFRSINWSSDTGLLNTILIDSYANIPVSIKRDIAHVGNFGILGIQ